MATARRIQLAALVIITGLTLISAGITVRDTPSPAASIRPRVTVWEPITLNRAIMLFDYSGREDWTGCETRGTSPLYVRCPDGTTMEIR